MDDNKKSVNTKKTGGLNRDLGYVSSDVDKTDDKGNPIIIYTSFENSGKINQYTNLTFFELHVTINNIGRSYGK